MSDDEGPRATTRGSGRSDWCLRRRCDDCRYARCTCDCHARPAHLRRPPDPRKRKTR